MLHKYNVIYSIWYYPRFHVTAVDFEHITCGEFCVIFYVVYSRNAVTETSVWIQRERQN
jgi:hypothetical protein